MDDNINFIQTLYKRCLISSMLAILGSILGQIFSTIIIGRTLGHEELSVIGITLPIYYVYAAVGALLGVGGTAVCAQLIGKRKYEESKAAFTIIYLLTLAAAAVLSVVFLVFSEQITVFLGVTADMDIFTKVRDYIRVLSIGGVFIMSIYPAFNLLRLDGRNIATIAVFFVMTSVNIILVSVFLLVLDTGVIGSAIAAVCGAGAAGIFGAVLLFFGSKNFNFTLPGIRNKASIKRITQDIILSGSPSALDNLCIVIRTVALNWILVVLFFNMTSLSAFKVTDSINSFASIFIAGVSGSMIPFISVFSTEKDTKSIRQLLVLGFKWGGAMIIAFTVLCLIFAKQTAGLFGMGGNESLGAALSAISIFVLSLPLAMINNILVCLYQADRNTAAANVLTLGRSLVWPVLIAFALAPHIGVASVWHSFWAAELLALICAVLLSVYYRSRNNYRSKLFLLDTEAEMNGTYKSLSVKNSAASITESVDGIKSFCDANKLSAKKTMAISLAVEETLLLIQRHCFAKDEDITVNVRILIWLNIIILRIRNVGKPFNPIDYYEKQLLKLPQNELTDDMDNMDLFSDNLGINMLLKLSKTVDYRNTFGVNNMTIIL